MVRVLLLIPDNTLHNKQKVVLVNRKLHLMWFDSESGECLCVCVCGGGGGGGQKP